MGPQLTISDQSAHIGGELTSLRAQLQTLEKDLGDYRDTNKKYTDQLIKVKVSPYAVLRNTV